MKKKFVINLIFVLFATSILAQSPSLFNYQAVIRNNNGYPITNKDISMKMSILRYDPTGILVYEEVFDLKTNEYGLLNLEIGNGINHIGNLENIDWADGPYFMQTALDSIGGHNYVIMGTSQLLSVPYAMHARTVEIDQVNDADSDPSNEIQNLELNDNILSIENGNSVELNTSSLWSKNTNNDIFYKNGNVGIGTSSPGGLLDIVGASDYTYGRTFLSLNNKSTDTHSAVGMKLFSGPETNFYLSISHHSSTYIAVPDHHNVSHVWNRGRGLALRSTGSNESCIRFQTSPIGEIVERMRLDKDGNLGIGTQNPKSKLQVSYGDVYIDNPQFGLIMQSPNGQCWRMTVDNNGNPVFSSVNCP